MLLTSCKLIIDTFTRFNVNFQFHNWAYVPSILAYFWGNVDSFTKTALCRTIHKINTKIHKSISMDIIKNEMFVFFSPVKAKQSNFVYSSVNTYSTFLNYFFVFMYEKCVKTKSIEWKQSFLIKMTFNHELTLFNQVRHGLVILTIAPEFLCSWRRFLKWNLHSKIKILISKNLCCVTYEKVVTFDQYICTKCQS